MVIEHDSALPLAVSLRRGVILSIAHLRQQESAARQRPDVRHARELHWFRGQEGQRQRQPRWLWLRRPNEGSAIQREYCGQIHIWDVLQRQQLRCPSLKLSLRDNMGQDRQRITTIADHRVCRASVEWLLHTGPPTPHSPTPTPTNC